MPGARTIFIDASPNMSKVSSNIAAPSLNHSEGRGSAQQAIRWAAQNFEKLVKLLSFFKNDARWSFGPRTRRLHIDYLVSLRLSCRNRHSP
jgi:hypothetical protein